MRALLAFDWSCKDSWKKSAKNTAVCLIGCSIGDNLTILFFQRSHYPLAMIWIMLLAMLMGLVTSVLLETLVLLKQFPFKSAIQVAFGMSFISMLLMEASANITSLLLVGGNRLMLTWWSIIPSWLVGYLGAWVYNYYKIRKYGKSCHG